MTETETLLLERLHFTTKPQKGPERGTSMEPLQHSPRLTPQQFSRVLIIVSCLAILQLAGIRQAEGALIGHWTFDQGSALDSTGNFGPLTLYGNATIANGALEVQSNGTKLNQIPTGWAKTSGYTGPPITSKTLVSWVTLTNLTNQGSGSAISIGKRNADTFDAIAYGTDDLDSIAGPNRDPLGWIAISDNWKRYRDFTPGYRENSFGKQTLMAISYAVTGNDVTITGYRDGTQIGQYTTPNAARWDSGEADVVFGAVAFHTGRPWGGLDGRISEARIYSTVLSPTEILELANPISSSKVEWMASGTIVDVLDYPKGPEGLKCFSAIGQPASVKATVSEETYYDAVWSTGWIEGTLSDARFASPFLPAAYVSTSDDGNPPNYVTTDRFRFEPPKVPANAASIALAKGSVSAGTFNSEWTDNRGCRYSVEGQETSRVTLKIGDVTGDRLFDSSDLVKIFAAGKYENDVAANWYEGDWNFDNRFDTSDLIEAFKTGAYEKAAASVTAVPEPASWVLTISGLLGLLKCQRRRGINGIRPY
jgi:hypothetical protein